MKSSEREYAVLGMVVESIVAVDAVSQVKTGAKGMHQDVPLDSIKIVKAERMK